MIKRFILTLLFLGLGVILCFNSQAYAATRYEYHTTAPHIRRYTYGDNYEGNTFTVGTVGANENFNITSTKWKLCRSGSPGIITAELKAVDGDGLPIGDVLSSGNYNGNLLTTSESAEVVEITMSSYELQASTQYAIYMTAPNGDFSNKLYEKMNLADTYAGGKWIFTTTGHGGWAIGSPSSDFYFEVYGTAVGAPQVIMIMGL